MRAFSATAAYISVACRFLVAGLLIGLLLQIGAGAALGADPTLEVRQITTGPLHHFFGYIGHVQNVPWNKSGRYIVALRTSVRDHLPDGH